MTRVSNNEICEGSGNRTPDLQTRTVRPSRQLFLEQIKVLLADDNARKKLTSEEVLASYRFWDAFPTGAGFELEHPEEKLSNSMPKRFSCAAQLGFFQNLARLSPVQLEITIDVMAKITLR